MKHLMIACVATLLLAGCQPPIMSNQEVKVAEQQCREKNGWPEHRWRRSDGAITRVFCLGWSKPDEELER